MVETTQKPTMRPSGCIADAHKLMLEMQLICILQACEEPFKRNINGANNVDHAN